MTTKTSVAAFVQVKPDKSFIHRQSRHFTASACFKKKTVNTLRHFDFNETEHSTLQQSIQQNVQQSIQQQGPNVEKFSFQTNERTDRRKVQVLNCAIKAKNILYVAQFCNRIKKYKFFGKKRLN